MAGGIKWGWGKKPATEKSPPAPAAKPQKSPRTKKTAGWTLISLNEDWLKIIHGQGAAAKKKVDFIGAYPVRGLDDEQISSELGAVLRANRLGGTRLLIAHPASFFRARALRLPSTDRDELKVMVDLQVEKHTPDAKEETRTYFRVCERAKDGYTVVFLVMTHQDRVDHAVRILQQASGNLSEVWSDMDGLIHAHQQAEKLSKKSPSGGVLLVDIDSAYATVLVLHGSEAYFHRSVPMNLAGLLKDTSGEMLKTLLGEIHRSVMAYDEEGVKGPCARIVLTGRADLIFGLSEQLQSQMNLPVEIRRMDSLMPLTSRAAAQLAQYGQVSFTAMLGLLQSPGEGDLTPPTVKMRRLFEKKVKRVGLLGGQILLAMLLAAAFLIRGVHRDTAYHDWLKTQTSKMEAPARQLEVAIEHLKIIKERLDQRGYFLDALTVLKQATPPAVRWDSLTYNRGQNLVLKGTSREMPKVFEMVTELEKSPLFSKPEARRVAKRKEDGKDVTGFEMVMPFWGSEDSDEAA